MDNPARRTRKAAGRSASAGAAVSPIRWRGCVWVLALAMVLAPGVAAAQQSSTGMALVRIPPVSELDVEAAPAPQMVSGDAFEGVVRIRVRSNQAWRVVLTAGASGGTVWVRATTAEGRGTYERLEAGAETVVAAGARGEAFVEVEYRVEGSEGSEPTIADAVPLTYTLATL